MNPSVIGKYSVLAKIGQGAMGEVFKAHDPVLNRHVAVKTIGRAASAQWDDDLGERFRREARAAAGLNHPNIVTIYDFGEENGTFFMAMELLEGTDLADLLRRRGLARLEDKLALIEQICDALAFAHAHTVVHRDLKPANIQILPGGAVKILDFGLAYSGEAQVTSSGWILGTPHYMSPEQVRGERADARSDVFALGALFYEVLTYQRPFPADTVHAALFQVLERQQAPVRSWDPAIPLVLDRTLHKALAKSPERRFRDAGELREALRRVRGVMAGERSEAEVLAALADPDAPPAPVGPSPSLSQAADAALGRTGNIRIPSPPAGSLRVPRVTFHGEEGGDRVVPMEEPASSLLDLALRAGIPHFHECGGRARCSTCRVRIVAGGQNVSPPNADEKKLAGRFNFSPDIRLACQLTVNGDVAVQRLILDTEDFGLLRHEAGQAAPAQEAALAVLSCELKNFAAFVRKFPPYDVVHVLNRFFLQIGEPVPANGGRIERYAGEEMTALFGLDGGDAREKCLAAVRAALRMAARMEELNRYTKSHFGTGLELGVGLHFGRMIVGQVGHPSKMQMAAIGEAPAVARRAQRANRENGTVILATENLVNVVEDDIQVGRVLQEDAPDGRETVLYELADFRKPDAVFIVQSSFETVNRRRDEAAELFYRLLFEVDPGTRALFSSTDMKSQGNMLMSMLGAAVQGLDRLDELRPVVEDLGRRHAGYGVQVRHFDAVEQALLETVQRMMGERFTLDVRLAWTRIYNQLAAIMIGAMGAG
ncbi:MAG TPA: protein kinase [Thermoanaerobaculia bacterium]|nr:protein kinase [Thermoanaerobaculia bacterium]